jgi:cellulase/cellobiase CelA1
LRKENITCNLISNNNYFTTAKKIEPKHYWRGYYKCKNCKSRYIDIIKEINDKKDVLINITIENDCKKCIEETIKIRSTGASRKDLAKDLMIKGTLNVKSDHLIFNEKNQENIQSKLPCLCL